MTIQSYLLLVPRNYLFQEYCAHSLRDYGEGYLELLRREEKLRFQKQSR